MPFPFTTQQSNVFCFPFSTERQTTGRARGRVAGRPHPFHRRQPHPIHLTPPSKMALDPKKLKVTELREELQKRGLDTTGLKAQLVERLEEALAVEAIEGVNEPVAVAKSSEPEQTGEAAAQPSSPAAAAPEKKDAAPAAAAETTEEDDELAKRKARAERFGIPLRMSEEELKKARAKRFGLPEKSNGALQRPGKSPKSSDDVLGKRKRGQKKKKKSGQEEQKRKQAKATPKKYTLEEMETLHRRSEKFGTPLPEGVLPKEEIELRKRRAERFAIPPKQD